MSKLVCIRCYFRHCKHKAERVPEPAIMRDSKEVTPDER